MKTQARENIFNNFNQETQINKLTDIYKQLIYN